MAGDNGNGNLRIGVYVCHCGSNIAGVIAPPAAAEYAATLAATLAYFLQLQGDAVGLLTMATESHGATRYLAPRRATASEARPERIPVSRPARRAQTSASWSVHETVDRAS